MQTGTKRKKVMQVTLALCVGGAERLAVDILAYGKEHFDGLVAGLYLEPGRLTDIANQKNVPWLALRGDNAGKIRNIIRLRQTMREHQADLVHAHIPYSLPVAIPAARLAGVPLMLTAHSTHELENIHWLRHFIRLFSGSIAQVACVNKQIRDFYEAELKIPKHKLRVIKNGIDTDIFAPGKETVALPWPAREKLFVFGNICRLHEAKHLENLLEAFARVNSRFENTRLLLVGDGEERESLGRLAEKLGISSRMHITGLRKDIPQCLNSLDSFVLSSRHEGMPLSLLEAMSCGVPAISTTVGDISSLNADDENLLLVPPEDSDSLAAAMETILTDHEKRNNLAKKGRQTILGQYSGGRMASQYFEMYAQHGVC